VIANYARAARLSLVEQAAERKMMRVETQAAQNPQVCTFVSQLSWWWFC
jgi:hypothetical protein